MDRRYFIFLVVVVVCITAGEAVNKFIDRRAEVATLKAKLDVCEARK